MSGSLTTAAVIHSPSPWWRSRAFWVPLTVVLANFAILIAWPEFSRRWLRSFPAAAWTWNNEVHQGYVGWTLAYCPLVGIWLCFSVDRAVIRFSGAAVAIAVGTLLVLCQWSGYWSFDFFRTYYLPMWPKLGLAAIQFVATVHLVLFPLRQFLGWRLDFSPAIEPPSSGRPFQFSLRDVAILSVVTAIALAAIRASTHLLAHAGKYDLFFMPTILRLMFFGQIVVPTLACAWLILGRKRQWIGGLVLALALACPPVLIQSGWHVQLSLGFRELWDAHWLNVGAVTCVGLNLLTLRLWGLRGAVIAREILLPTKEHASA